MEKKNVYCLVTFNQPDLLFVHLNQIAQSPIVDKFKIMVFTEEGHDPENHAILAKFPQLDIHLTVRKKDPQDKFPGLRNIILSYVDAAKEAKEFLVIAETDIVGSLDYLEYANAVYESFLKKYDRIFCAVHNIRNENELEGDPNIIYGDKQFTSPSVISVKAVEKYIAPIINDDWFHDPPLFYFENFPHSELKPWLHMHHDGGLQRIMEKHDLFTIKPIKARDAHIGLQGINQGGKSPQGTLEEKLIQWDKIMRDGDLLRSLSNLPYDMCVCDFFTKFEWRELKLDLDREFVGSRRIVDGENEFKKYIENSG